MSSSALWEWSRCLSKFLQTAHWEDLEVYETVGLACCVNSTGFNGLNWRWMKGSTWKELNYSIEFNILPQTLTNQTWEFNFGGTPLVTPSHIMDKSFKVSTYHWQEVVIGRIPHPFPFWFIGLVMIPIFLELIEVLWVSVWVTN